MFELIAIAVLLIGGICIGTRYGKKIPLIKRLAKKR